MDYKKTRLFSFLIVFVCLLSFFFSFKFVKEARSSEDVFVVKLRAKGRKLIQDDMLYIMLEKNIFPLEKRLQAKESGYLVLKKDEHNIAKFVKIYDEQDLEKGEFLVKYFLKYYPAFIKDKKGKHLAFAKDSLSFSKHYELEFNQARYVEYGLNSKNQAIITNLLDNKLKPIDVNLFK